MKLINFVIPALLLAGCAGKPDSAIISSQISDSGNLVLNITEPLKAEDQIIEKIIESARVIPLETSGQSVISRINNIAAGKQCIFVGDEAQNVLVFDFDGHLIKRLSSGQGPEEFAAAYSIKYLPKENCFYLFDNMLAKILKFDGLGNYIAHYPALRMCSDFFPIEDGFLYFQDIDQNQAKEFSIISTDSLSHVRKTWALGPGVLDVSIQDNFHLVDGEIVFGMPLSSQIYAYKDGEITKRCQIVHDGMAELDYSQRPSFFDVKAQYPESYFLRQGSIESGNYLFLNMTADRKIPKAIFYNKSAGKYFSQNICRLPDSFFSWIDTIEGVSGSDGDTFIGIVEPALLLNDVEYMDYGWDGSNPNNLISPEDMEKLKSVKPDDNPIIVLFKLKSDL